MAEIIDFKRPSAESKWAADAKTLAGLDEGKALVITGEKTDRTLFQRAARAEGVTAKCEVEEELEDGTFRFTFTATALRTRKRKGEADADADAEVDAKADVKADAK